MRDAVGDELQGRGAFFRRGEDARCEVRDASERVRGGILGRVGLRAGEGRRRRWWKTNCRRGGKIRRARVGGHG